MAKGTNDRWANNDLQNIAHKTADRVPWTPLKPEWTKVYIISEWRAHWLWLIEDILKSNDKDLVECRVVDSTSCVCISFFLDQTIIVDRICWSLCNCDLRQSKHLSTDLHPCPAFYARAYLFVNMLSSWIYSSWNTAHLIISHFKRSKILPVYYNVHFNQI